MQELVAAKVLVAQVNLMTAPTKEKLARSSRRRSSSGSRRRSTGDGEGLDPSAASGSADRDRQPRGRLVQLLLRRRRSPADIDATLERLLSCRRDRRQHAGAGSSLVLDEFQEVPDIDRRPAELMRSVFEQQPDVAHIYLGSKRHMMESIFNDENEPFWR